MTMESPLWPHQQEAVDKLEPLGSGFLFMGMGTGKSRVAIELLRRWKCSRTLIVCPLRVVQAWGKQFRQFGEGFAPPLLLDKGSTKKRGETLYGRLILNGVRDERLVAVTNYEAAFGKGFLYDVIHLGNDTWDCLVLDECTHIKAASGARSRDAARFASNIPHRLGLTGTPCHDKHTDPYAQFRAVRPDVFGYSHRQFLTEFAVTGYEEALREHLGPDWEEAYRKGEVRGEACDRELYRKLGNRAKYYTMPFQKSTVVGARNEERLGEKMASVSYQVGNEVLNLLPYRTVDYEVQLTGEALRGYRALEKEFIAHLGDGEEVVAANVLAQVLRLQMWTSGWANTTNEAYTEVGVDKRNALGEFLSEVDPGEAVVVFGQFRGDMENVIRAAKHAGRVAGLLCGGRNDLAAFQGGEVDVLGVQISAGCEGIDLTRARYGAFLSTGYSLGNYQQALARLHRPGQERGVEFLRFQAAGTVDEKVLAALENKADLISSVMEGYAKPKRRKAK